MTGHLVRIDIMTGHLVRIDIMTGHLVLRHYERSFSPYRRQ